MTATTWGELLTDLWNTEIMSGPSFVAVFILVLLFGRSL